MEMDIEGLILIVTGAHLRAEAADRPVAYRLRARVAEWVQEHPMNGASARVVVCSDLWYMNHPPLRSRPTISIGGPAVNALTAFLADKLPSVYVVDDSLLVQADPEFLDLVACCWGRSAQYTAAATDAFVDRYFQDFMHAATTRH